jgi:hypothetical protein
MWKTHNLKLFLINYLYVLLLFIATYTMYLLFLDVANIPTEGIDFSIFVAVILIYGVMSLLFILCVSVFSLILKAKIEMKNHKKLILITQAILLLEDTYVMKFASMSYYKDYGVYVPFIIIVLAVTIYFIVYRYVLKKI